MSADSWLILVPHENTQCRQESKRNERRCEKRGRRDEGDNGRVRGEGRMEEKEVIDIGGRKETWREVRGNERNGE